MLRLLYGTNSVPTFPLRCTTRLHAERARRSFLRERRYYAVGVLALLPTWPRLASPRLFRDSDTLGSPFHAFPPFFSLSLLSRLHAITFLPLPLSRARSLLPHPFLSFFLPLPPLQPPRAFVGETFFQSITFIGRPPFVRAPGPRCYPLINCDEKKYIK